MEAREVELLAVPYFHTVFTLPGPIADIAYQNKAVVHRQLRQADTLGDAGTDRRMAALTYSAAFHQISDR
jgi:hypothetical protein